MNKKSFLLAFCIVITCVVTHAEEIIRVDAPFDMPDIRVPDFPDRDFNIKILVQRPVANLIIRRRSKRLLWRVIKQVAGG